MLRVLVLAALVAAPIDALLRPSRGSDEGSAVAVRASDGTELAGTFYAPAAKTGASPTPGVLMVHDAGSDRHQLDDLALKLQKSGFAVLTLDLRSHGQSRGKDGGWGDLVEDEKTRVWALATRDIDAGAAWLLAQSNVHSTNLSLVGVGSGCALAVRHARTDENVRCVVLMAPRAKDFGFDVAADLQKIEGLPTLVVTAKDDEQARVMVEEANKSSAPFVELDYAAVRAANVLEDRKVPGRVATWIKDCAMPKRGRG